MDVIVVALGIIGYLLSLFVAAYWWRHLICRVSPIVYVNTAGLSAYLLEDGGGLAEALLANILFSALTVVILAGIWYEHYRPSNKRR